VINGAGIRKQDLQRTYWQSKKPKVRSQDTSVRAKKKKSYRSKGNGSGERLTTEDGIMPKSDKRDDKWRGLPAVSYEQIPNVSSAARLPNGVETCL
jgi:hypothetical protein